MASIAMNDISGQVVAEIVAISKLNVQFAKHNVLYIPFESDLRAKEVMQRLLNELQTKSGVFAPKTQDFDLLRSLRENLHNRLVGAKLSIFGTPLEKMQNRVLRDMDLKRHETIIIKEVAQVLRDLVSRTPVAYRPFSKNKDFLNLVSNLALYFAGNPLSEYPLDKGIYLYGLSQKGKTILFKALQIVFKDTIMAFGIVDCTELLNNCAFSRIDISDEMGRFLYGNLLFDDIGNIDPMLPIKGNSINIIAAIYRERLSRAEKSGGKSFFTSNFDLEGLELRQNKFGNAFFSKTEIERIRLHCTIIAMPIN